MDAHGQHQQQAGAPIQRQGSFTLPRTLSQKTVDEVWREIVGLTDGEDAQAVAAPAPTPAHAPLPAQGLFSQGNAVALAPQTMQLGNGVVTGVVGQGLGGGMTVAVPTTPVVFNGMGKVEAGDLSSLSPVPYPFDTALRVRKGPTVEKVVERRQRRMIKNRESAARSRARKQAYIIELEAEVAKLKDLNDELQKKQVEMLKKQKDEVLERINNQHGPKAKKLCLHRTLTGPW
uniref:BZIP domain-containing protein n=1 Tax=Zea mays TaxID=4577 RepID=C0PBV5_MAIZE|nr:unknown [Zea mays]